MTESSSVRQPALGVGDIFGNTFSIFFSRFVYIVPLALIPAFASECLSYLLVGPEAYLGDMELSSAPNPGAVLLSELLGLIGQTLATAFVILAAYDAILRRPGRFGFYIARAMQSLVPAVICSVVIGIGIGLGALLLIVPGIYLQGVWCVVIPAIVVERAGFGSLGRSSELTRDYRWSCVGTLILLSICVFIFAFVIGAGLGFIVALLDLSEVIVRLTMISLGSGVGMGLWGVGVALIYARLREIKEGATVEDIVEVFS